MTIASFEHGGVSRARSKKEESEKVDITTFPIFPSFRTFPFFEIAEFSFSQFLGIQRLRNRVFNRSAKTWDLNQRGLKVSKN